MHESIDGVDGYAPQPLQWAELWKGLSPPSRHRRFAAAVKREALVKAVAARKAGASERAAVRRFSGTDTSIFRRWKKPYAKRVLAVGSARGGRDAWPRRTERSARLELTLPAGWIPDGEAAGEKERSASR